MCKRLVVVFCTYFLTYFYLYLYFRCLSHTFICVCILDVNGEMLFVCFCICSEVEFELVTTLCAMQEEAGVAGAADCDVLKLPPPTRAVHMQGKIGRACKKKGKSGEQIEV